MEGKEICSAATANNQSKNLETAHIPEKVIPNILVRLPVKSLLKFRCVSKSWRSLISSPQFVKDHLEFSINNADSTNQRIMFTYPKECLRPKQCPISPSMFETTTFGSDIEYPCKLPPEIVGSCNGIICFESGNSMDFSLWNPSTRKLKVVPRFMGPGLDMWGFGYSQSEDDYKIIGMYDQSFRTSLAIYSLRNDSWKSIEDARFKLAYYTSRGMFASGKLHYLGFPMNDDYSMPMEEKHKHSMDMGADNVSIDLKSGASAIVKKPNYDEDGCFTTYLGLLGGCLSFICHYLNIRADVWVLKEYGVNESWTKVVSINDHLGRFYYPMFFMPNDELVVGFGGPNDSLAFYNMTDKCFRFSQVSNFRNYCIYFESMVPV